MHLQQHFICSLPKSVFLEVPARHAAVNGKWHLPANSKTIPDPYNGEAFVKVPDPQVRFVSRAFLVGEFCHLEHAWPRRIPTVLLYGKEQAKLCSA